MSLYLAWCTPLEYESTCAMAERDKATVSDKDKYAGELALMGYLALLLTDRSLRVKIKDFKHSIYFADLATRRFYLRFFETDVFFYFHKCISSLQSGFSFQEEAGFNQISVLQLSRKLYELRNERNNNDS